MPTHSGISFEVLSQLELSRLPEFAHPESSQFTFRSPGRKGKSKTTISDWTPPAVSASSKADVLLGRNTTCSVYVPSQPGAQFWLRYEFNAAAQARSKYYYFKLFMNGRHIASFGVDSTKTPHGQIMHGLYDPSSAWNYEHNGEIWKNNGLEVRSFLFAKPNKKRSVANDGGLIEVLCYRAAGRQRKLPDPEVWRDLQDYGIITPSEGLHPNPEDVKFYDWDLLDQKDTPFVVFKFHYRSWDSLQALELIPPCHIRALLSPSRKILPEELQAMLEVQKHDLAFLSRPHSPCEDCVPSSAPLSDTSSIDSTDLDLFNGPCPKTSKQANEEQEFLSENEASPLAARRCKGRVPTSQFTESVEDLSLQNGSPDFKNKVAVGELLNRPLPEIPVRKSSRLRLSRTSSMKSQAPSLTPSLISWFDRELSSPEPAEILEVKRVHLIGPISPPCLESDSDPMENSDLLETPIKNGALFETFISTESSMLPSIEEMSPMLPRPRSRSPTGFSPKAPMTAIKRKPIAHMAIAHQQNIAHEKNVGVSSHADPFLSPHVTMRKHRRSTTFKNIPKSNTTANLATQREQEVPRMPPMRHSSILKPAPPESHWMSRPQRVPTSSSMRSGLGHESAWKATSPTLPTSTSSQSGFGSTHSNHSYQSNLSNHSNGSGLKNVVKVLATKGGIIGGSLKRNSKNFYRKARNSADMRSSEDSFGSSQNSVVDNAVVENCAVENAVVGNPSGASGYQAHGNVI